MNERERFQTICKGKPVDYVPLIGLPGASGLSFGGAWGHIYQRLLQTGMPSYVRGWNYETGWDERAAESWSRYWGTLTPLTVDFWPSEPCKGVQSKIRRQGQYEIVEYDTGAVTRQVLDCMNAYSMPEFIAHHVRDRKSWEYYKSIHAYGQLWSVEKIDQACRRFDNRTKPLFLSLLSTWGGLRDLMGTERACTILYDDSELAQEIIDWQANLRKEYLFPLIERLKPEILKIGEDCCYNHGMLVSPQHFMTHCGPSYRDIVSLAKSVESDVIVVDTDGNVMELVPILASLGINGIYPLEAKSNNDVILLRRQFPEFVFFGWLEKEVINEGNEGMIDNEILSKVPEMIKTGRYFPNLDHSLQPMCTFRNLCRFLTRLHGITNNPLGEFPRSIP